MSSRGVEPSLRGVELSLRGVEPSLRSAEMSGTDRGFVVAFFPLVVVVVATPLFAFNFSARDCQIPK